MGAYLSEPKIEKVSTDESNESLIVGSSSMQGWRNSQEDAHNAILDFDSHTSFFAVYDGHGGAEVATYCADKLPQFLKSLESYKNGKLEISLKEAFIGFDKTLLEPEVIEILKVLAGDKNFTGSDEDGIPIEEEEEEDDEDLAELHEESRLPLNEVLDKYRGCGASLPSLKNIKDSASGSKPQSPFLRGRRAAAVAADAANRAVMDPDSKPQGSSTSAAAAAAAAAAFALKTELGVNFSKPSISKVDNVEPEEDSTVSSSSSSASKTNNVHNTNSIEGTEAEATQNITNGTQKLPSLGNKINLPDSSYIKEREQNGNVSSSEAKAIKADVSTSAGVTTATITTDIKNVNDATVTGSTDATSAKQNQNGIVGSSSTLKNNIPNIVDRADISSTSKEAKKLKHVFDEEDSTDDDADYDVEVENSSADDNDAHMSHDLSSSDELDDEEDNEEEEEELDDDDDDDDDDEDGDEEAALANEQFCANMIEEPGKDSGCTAVVALLRGRDLYVANAGDSRCVICRNGRAIEMSLDHKPEDDEESSRIIKAGGRVTVDGRVNGGLNLSRAIGDHAYKMNTELPAEEQMISALPDIKKLIISPEDEFMVLACDGIWNFMSSDEVVDFVRSGLKDESKKVSKICEELFENCLAPNTLGDGTGCDNMTAVIVRFQTKLLEKPSIIDPNTTEDLLAGKRTVKNDSITAVADADDDIVHKSLKRSASPTPEDNSNEAENTIQTKRMKTDEETSSSTIPLSINEKASSSSSSIPANLDTTLPAGRSECDSGITTQANSEAIAAVSST